MILAIDQGTSSTKACVYAPPGELRGSASVPVAKSSAGGRVWQDPEELVESCRVAAREALRRARLRPEQLAGVALANQGESFVLFDAGGSALTPVIGWQDTDCADELARVAESWGAGPIEHMTGLPLHALFCAPKLQRELRALAPTGAVRFGTLDTWLIARLSPVPIHVTDRATASRTMLIGLEDEDWSTDLTALFGVPRDALATIRPCDDMAATIMLDGVELPLLASGYDMGLALLGHGCLSGGSAKATFGTCLGAMLATDASTRADGLLTTIAYTRGTGVGWALDGEIAAAGALVSWAVKLGIAGSLQELDALAAEVPRTEVVLVPAIQGLGAPHWRDDVSAAFIGMTEETDRRHLARAVHDAIAWSLFDVVDAFAAAGSRPTELSVDGGLTSSDFLMQRCADVLQIPLRMCGHAEATAFGAAALAMLGSGHATVQDVREGAAGAQVVEPHSPPSVDERDAWRRALASVLDETPTTA